MGETKMIADKGYVGGEIHLPNIKVATETKPHKPLRKKRTVVENYFGRLKRKYEVIGGTFPLDESSFDDVFNVSCCLINIELEKHPLKASDRENNKNIMKNIDEKGDERKGKGRVSNGSSRLNKREELESIITADDEE